MTKQFGIKSIQELSMFPLDEEGNILLPENSDIELSDIIPLIKLPSPEFDELNYKAVPTLVWLETEVQRDWTIEELSNEEKVRAFKALVSERRKSMAAILESLPIDVQAALFTTRLAVEQACDRGFFQVARSLIANQVVPPELEEVKQSILNLFPSFT